MAGTARGDDSKDDSKDASKEPSDLDGEPEVLPDADGAWARGERAGAMLDPTVEARWLDFERQLAAQLSRMDDAEESDLLIVEVPGFDDDAAPGTAPYVQFAAAESGEVLHTEVSGDAHLRPRFRLDAGDSVAMRRAGWSGATEEDPNWFRDDPVDAVRRIASSVVVALRHRFGVAHPDLLTYRAWGPAAQVADQLGLCASAAVPVDTVDVRTSRGRGAGESEDLFNGVVHQPESRDDLLLLVGQVLQERFDDVAVDDDGDFVLRHVGQPVFVRALSDQPAVQIFARVVHGVQSRRDAAVEIGLLNRDQVWMKWSLREHSVWQSVMVPAMPFVEIHLALMIDLFLLAMEETRDDLALRTKGEVA